MITVNTTILAKKKKHFSRVAICLRIVIIYGVASIYGLTVIIFDILGLSFGAHSL